MAAASTATVPTLLSIEQYLNTTYRPDVDFVDGHIEERNLGEYDHGDLQSALDTFFRNRRKEWSIRVVVETRVQVASTRVRIPDVCIIEAGRKRERIISQAPLLCIEVLSPRDSVKSMRKRAQDYFDMGVTEVWIFDPESRKAYACTAQTMVTHEDGIMRLPGTRIELPVIEVFATLDE